MSDQLQNGTVDMDEEALPKKETELDNNVQSTFYNNKKTTNNADKYRKVKS